MEVFMRLRTIKPGFFANEELAELPPLTRILFAGLWCYADREGRLKLRPKRIKAAILPYDDCDIATMLEDLAARGFIRRFTVEGTDYLDIVEFHKHQRPHRKEAASTIPSPPEHLPRSVPVPAKVRAGTDQGDDEPAQSLGTGIPSLGNGTRTPPLPPASAGESRRRQRQPYVPKHADTPKLIEYLSAAWPRIQPNGILPGPTRAHLQAGDRLIERVGAAAVAELIDFFADVYRPSDEFDWRPYFTGLTYFNAKWVKLDAARRKQLGLGAPAPVAADAASRTTSPRKASEIGTGIMALVTPDGPARRHGGIQS